ncbi:MAG: DUF4179 domain-containing protein [Clostridiales bacterium]|nr:DUF4179 domain-containing protein [Clostridiales bacterium]
MNKENILKENIEIPEIVNAKAEEALDKIKSEAYTKKPKRRKKVIFIAAAAAVISVSAAAATMHWSTGINGMLSTSDTEKGQAVQTGLADFPEAVAEANGIKITAEQSITDNNYTLISLKIEGASIESDEEPIFENIDVTLDGEKVDYEAGFAKEFYGYDETLGFAEDDGSLEYIVLLTAADEGQLLDKDIHIELENFSIYKDKTALIDSTEGKWELDWTLKGYDSIYSADINIPVGDSGLTVKSVEISPISVKVVYNYPKEKEYETVIDAATGDEGIVMTYVKPAGFAGIVLKDGTEITGIAGSGEAGYTSDNEFFEKYTVNRILDADEIEAIIVADLTDTEDWDEADTYYVNIR